MARVAVAESDPEPAREPHSVCDDCGRRGTAARVIWRGDARVVYRYCRRCWPAAHRRTIVEVRDAYERSATAWLDAVHAAHTSPDAAPVVDGPPLLVTVKWDWLLIPGSLWREYRMEETHAPRGSQ